MNVKRVAWMGGVWLMLSAVLAAGAATPGLALVPVAPLPCAALTGMRAICQAMSHGFTQSHDVTAQIAVLQKLVTRPAIRRSAELFTKTCGNRGHQSLDCGVARMLAGQVGEGMQMLLTRYEQLHGDEATGTFAYLGLLLRWPELDALQQQDWAKDLAGRLIAPLPTPSITARARIIGLYRTAGEMDKVQELERR